MKTLGWLASGLLTFALVVLGAGVLVLTTLTFEVDATSWRGWITEWVGDRTGFAVQVDGELHLQFGPTLGIRARGLRVPNPVGDGADDLLSAETAFLAAEAVPLLSGQLRPTSLELDSAGIAVQRDRKGMLNWLGGAEETSAREGGEAVGDSFLRLGALNFRVRKSSLTYSDRRSGEAWKLRLETADIVQQGDALRIDLEGSLNGRRLRLKGGTTTLPGLIAAEGPVPLRLQGDLLGLRVEAKGSVANPWSGAAVSADLSLSGESLEGLRPWLGEKLAALGPVKASLAVEGGGGTYRVEPFDLELGEGRFDGTLTADFSQKPPVLNLNLGIEEVDLRPVFPSGGADDGHTGPRTQLFSTEPLPTQWMGAADLRAKIRVENLTTPFGSNPTVSLNLTLLERRLKVELAGKAKGNRDVSANLEVDGNDAPMRAVLRLKGDKLQLEPMLIATRAHGLIRGDVDVSADIRASGASADALSRNLQGDVLLLVEQAEADVKGLDRMAGGTNALVGQLVTPRQKLAKVNCGVAAFRFEAGRTKVRAVLDTPYSTVIATGELDLGAEILDVRVVPDPKGVTLSVATPVVVQGPLGSPRIQVEEGGLVVTLTDLASKIAVPHLVLVDAFGDAVAENPCVRVATGQIEDEGVKPMDMVTKPVEGLGKGAGAVVKGTGKVLKEAGSAVVKGAGGLVEGLLGGGRQDPRTRSEDSTGDKDESLFETE